VTDIDPGPSRPVRAAVVAVVVLPIVVAVVRALRHHWFPIGDDALLYIRVHDVFTGHHPLLGSWTSASLSVGTNMNNPGPIYQDLLAPVAHVFSPGPGAAIGVGLANIAAIVGVSAGARHIGGWAMQRWLLLACAALSWTMGSELLFDLWQAHALLLPFLAYLVLLVGISIGRTRCIPWAIAVASVLVQTHISYAYILGTLTPFALLLVWWDHRPLTRAAIRTGLRSRTALVSVVVFVVLWVQSFVEQLFGEGQGNLSRLAANSGGGDVHVGIGNATKIVAAIVALPPWWLRRGFSTTVPSTKLTDTPGGARLIIPSLPGAAVSVLAIVVLVALLVLLALRCRRAGLVLQSNAAVLAAAGVAMAIVCLTLLTVGRGGLAAHHVRWVWPFAVFVQIVVAWAAVSLLVHHLPDRPRLDRLVTPAVIALASVFTILNLPFHAENEGPVADRAAMPALRHIFPELGVLAGVQPVVYDTSTLRVFEPYSSAVMMRLQQLGIEFRVTDEAMVRQLGNGRRADGTETTTIFQLEGSQALLFAGPGCPVAVANGLSDTDATHAHDVAELLAGGLVGGTISIDPSTLSTDEIALLDAATGGDLVAARRAVLEGHLTTWVRAGLATVDPSLPQAVAATLDGDARDGLEPAFDLVDRWVISTYGVFARSPQLCGA